MPPARCKLVIGDGEPCIAPPNPTPIPTTPDPAHRCRTPVHVREIVGTEDAVVVVVRAAPVVCSHGVGLGHAGKHHVQ
eukprot:2127228-Prymnesium_polylepis.2